MKKNGSNEAALVILVAAIFALWSASQIMQLAVLALLFCLWTYRRLRLGKAVKLRRIWLYLGMIPFAIWFAAFRSTPGGFSPLFFYIPAWYFLYLALVEWLCVGRGGRMVFVWFDAFVVFTLSSFEASAAIGVAFGAERPSQEDLYWLFRKNARIRARLISSTIEPKVTQPSSKKKYYLNKGNRLGLLFAESKDFSGFWDLLDSCLQEGHGAHPVHSKAELELLSSRFPKNIKLYTVTLNGELLSGSVVYISSQVAHAQYLASSAKGRSLNAMDFLMMNETNAFPEVRWLDWGTSNEEQGRVLNEGLVHQKEICAARGVAYDIYEYDL